MAEMPVVKVFIDEVESPLTVCEDCGALLVNRELHIEWHERLRRAVDEGDMLE